MSGMSKRRRFAASLVSVGAVLAVSTTLTSAGASAAPAHVDNPFAGATQYVNEAWSANVEGAASRAGGTLGTQMLAIAEQPTFVWMDRISAIAGNADGAGLRSHLDAALAQQKGTTPIIVSLVIYDLPGRDCYALASNGELPATDAGMARYKSEYIDPIAAMLGESKYEGIRFVTVIEPDSLPNLVTNSSDSKCAAAAPYYREGVKYALDKLHAIPNVYTYVDAAHSGWLGWDDNFGKAISLFAEVARTTSAGVNSIDGFVTDTANTTPLEEPFLPDSSKSIGGNPIRSSDYYEWNPYFDEADYAAAFYTKAVAAGFPSSLGMIIDTSRNGWGGSDRPTAVSSSTDLNTYVNESRVDRRVHRGAWCNPLGAGIGERPQASPSGYSGAHLDAFVWVKPPGESDGSSTEIPNDQGKGFDRMCDPTFVSPKLGDQLTGATPGAPLSGAWFEEQFKTLVTNAYPAIGGGGTPTTDTQAPTAPGTPTVSSITSSGATLTWAASTDNVKVTGYTVQNASTGATLATATGTTTTLSGLAASTAYSVRVVAKDAAGNASTASGSATFTTTAGGGTTTGGCTAALSLPNSWAGGYQAEVKVTAGTSALTGWTVSLTLPSGSSISSLWSGTNTGTSGTVTVTNVAWNGSLGAGQSTSFGFTGTGTAPTAGSVTCTAK
jgi:cellulose 1,4-beta-cellobiosidase